MGYLFNSSYGLGFRGLGFRTSSLYSNPTSDGRIGMSGSQGAFPGAAVFPFPGFNMSVCDYLRNEPVGDPTYMMRRNICELTQDRHVRFCLKRYGSQG